MCSSGTFRATSWGLGLDFHEHACGNHQAVQCINGLRVRIGNVDDPLVRTDFKLLATLLVDEWRTVDGVDFPTSWQRNGSRHTRAANLGLLHDFSGARIEHLMVVRFESYANSSVHSDSP